MAAGPDATKSTSAKQPLSEHATLFAMDLAEFDIRKLAAAYGIDPTAVLSAVRRKDAVGQFILAMLGLSGVAAAGKRGRPRDTEREWAIFSVVNALLLEGKSEAMAFQLAPKHLAERGVRGNGRDEMTAAAVRRSYRRNPASMFAVLGSQKKFGP